VAEKIGPLTMECTLSGQFQHCHYSTEFASQPELMPTSDGEAQPQPPMTGIAVTLRSRGTPLSKVWNELSNFNAFLRQVRVSIGVAEPLRVAQPSHVVNSISMEGYSSMIIIT